MQIKLREFSQQAYQHLHAQGVHPVLARLLAARQVHSQTEIGGELSDLIAPDQLLGIKQMASLIADAILRHEKILVIGDYDCDGATATAVALKALRRMEQKSTFWSPIVLSLAMASVRKSLS